MQHDQGNHNPSGQPPIQAPDWRPEDTDPPRLRFWRRGSRHAAEPPPPIWELPEPPTLWTRLKQQARQQADRWLGNRKRDDRRDGAPGAATQGGQQPTPQRTRRREDTASLRPPAETSGPDDTDISSEVLEYAYEAVRQGRITDPDTIRQLASRFARLTEDEESGPELPFDPREAMRQLRQRAAEIAQRRGPRDEEDPPPTQSGEGSSSRDSGGSGSPRRPTPRVERDENITRGG